MFQNLLMRIYFIVIIAALCPFLAFGLYTAQQDKKVMLLAWQTSLQEVAAIDSGTTSVPPPTEANKAKTAELYPVYREGKLIGHIEANAKLDDIELIYIKTIHRWLLSAVVVWGVLSVAMAFIYSCFVRRLNRLLAQIAREDYDAAAFKEIPPLLPVLTTVKNLRTKYLAEVEHVQQLMDASPLTDLFNVCPVAIVAVDKTGVVRAYNAEYSKLTQGLLSTGSIEQGASINDIHRAIGFDKEQGVLYHALQGIHVKQKIFRVSDREWLSNASPMRDGRTGAVVGAIAAIYDITEYQQMQREVSRLDRLNIVGEMAASVAHEIRNPMTTVRGYLQHMALKSSDKDKYDLLIEELDRANGLINEYLSIVRKNTKKKTPGDINQVIRSLQPLLYACTVKQGILLEAELDEAIPAIVMDATEIRQLLLNLYRNAEDAIPSKGKVIIRTKRQANGVCLQVEDTGCGIPATHLSRIMEPFYTTKSTGTGLGLAVCRNIAEQHNAQLTITSVEGAGTTVSIVFSLCPEKE